MSFKFNWPCFDLKFYEITRNELEKSLNKGKKPANICDDISVKELDMGSIAPELEILEIAELSAKRFKGIFKLIYTGDAYLVLQTKVQANPVTPSRSVLAESGILAANKPLIVPMQLKISHFRLNGIVTLVICKEKGVTCCFKNDPLESVKVSSTFDSMENVRRYLQMEIENRLCELFREELPSFIHQFSLLKLNAAADSADMKLSRRDWRSNFPSRWNSVTPPGNDSNDNDLMADDLRETKSEGNSVEGEHDLFYLKSSGIIHRTVSDPADVMLFDPYFPDNLEIRRDSVSLKKSRRPSRTRSSSEIRPLRSESPMPSIPSTNEPNSPEAQMEGHISKPKITQFSAILSSQYTLSPFTRSFGSFISRSNPSRSYHTPL